ncbi:A/G-specific adenine glycosylase [Homoserinibacter sp. YIM 151385]|uniref:A/G-specific adenine glycosylase n=1 Tax=Homoserinibacter sp. YIM 151385 TaxID=2985506 RepID=UPI0022EFF0CB|nr:A/G-specific adenine glycosylase [Homoserinibacter sp. YIM 151385]WBU38335.1 A/G-specific adenine glycosylase [Homoserinibacter sp. YIM 151385]
MDAAREIAAWFRASARDLPWRRAGFSAWGTLVSEFMLQQTQVERVIPRLASWLERWPTPAHLAAEPASEAIRAWDRLGYPRRALALHGAATAIAERYENEVPSDVDELLALPGVGPYTARAVAVFAHGGRHPVVDTNIRRVLARALDGQAEPGPPRTRADLERMDAFLPEDRELSVLVNAGTMELGQTVCTARAPRCGACPIAAACAWRTAGYPDYEGPRAPRQARFEGSDRQVRGLVLRALRGSEIPVPREAVAADWPDAAQRERAIAGLLRDRLVVETASGLGLPD